MLADDAWEQSETSCFDSTTAGKASRWGAAPQLGIRERNGVARAFLATLASRNPGVVFQLAPVERGRVANQISGLTTDGQGLRLDERVHLSDAQDEDTLGD